MTEILESLEKNILDASEEIARHPVGSQEYNSAVRTAADLSRIYMEMDAKDRERMRADEASVDQERELIRKQEQQKWDNRFKVATTVVNTTGKVLWGLGVGTVLLIGCAYERHDTISNNVLKQVFKDITRIKL